MNSVDPFEYFAGGVVIPADRLTLAEYFARNAPRRVMPAGVEISYSNIGMALAGYLVAVRRGNAANSSPARP